VVRVDYVAFCQPTSFDENFKWCIERFAPVRGHELVTRAESISDLVVHSEERKLLWQSLCERAEHDDVYKSQM